MTEVVADVDADPRYLACFASTKSEIVVPIFDGGDVIGEIDIDGSDPEAFDDTDARFLEEVAALLAPLRPGRNRPRTASVTWSTDHGPFEQVYDAHVVGIYRFVYARVGNHPDAEDLTAQVFVRAVEQLDTDARPGQIAAWLYRVAHNATADYWRAFYRLPLIGSRSRGARLGAGRRGLAAGRSPTTARGDACRRSSAASPTSIGASSSCGSSSARAWPRRRMRWASPAATRACSSTAPCGAPRSSRSLPMADDDRRRDDDAADGSTLPRGTLGDGRPSPEAVGPRRGRDGAHRGRAGGRQPGARRDGARSGVPRAAAPPNARGGRRH